MNDHSSHRDGLARLGLRVPLKLLFVFLASILLCGMAFGQQFTLSIQSTPITSVPITVTPNDVNGNADGSTNYTLTYDTGTAVQVTAPFAVGSSRFVYWTLDGVQQTLGQPQLNVNMSANHTVVATYVPISKLTVESQNPNSGVPITASADVDGSGNGTTTFLRFYTPGSSQTVTAPSSQGANNFDYWSLDGVTQTVGQTSLTVDMSSDHVVIAVYQTYTLTVQSQNPNSGVAITDSVLDVNGAGNGTTTFTRTYNTGQAVGLTAPATASGNVFGYWTLDGAQQTAGQKTLNVTMGANHNASAVYFTQYMLTVQSQNPGSGVGITDSPNDVNGSGNGTTSFTRTYDAGGSVTLTAPATASGNVFGYWTLDGTQQTVGQSTLNLTMGANHTAVAVYLTQYTLNVQSQNPGSGVGITDSPNDVNGNGNGTTSFARTYDSGATVNLTAPATASGNVFAYWTFDGAQQTAGQTTLSLTMGGNHTAVAVYVTQYALNVQSQNPNSGVAITDSPNDVNGSGNGTTSFTRTYVSGTTVTLTAPATASGNVFAYWTLDGVQQAAGQTTLKPTMGAAHTAVAVYLTQVTLTIQSQNPNSGVGITDSPNDVNGSGNGTTSFTRTYDTGTSVTLVAPSTASGNVFAYWTLDGVQQTAGQTTLTFSMGASHTAVAVYMTQFSLTVQSQNPASGVDITDSPKDVNNNGNGTTSFTRTYNTGASVTLTAPATASGNTFAYWTLDGTQQTAGQVSLTVSMGASHTAVAVYLTQFTLTVQSQNPASGVGITDSLNDVNGNGNGTTSFARTYNAGASVTLTAPATASGNTFAYWTLDGTQQTAGQTSLTLTVSANHTAVAVYLTLVTLTVQSLNPTSGVSVSDSPNDVNGHGNGTTTFTRSYTSGTSVTLTAPATAMNNKFVFWTVDGTNQTAGQANLNLTLGASHTVVAVYGLTHPADTSGGFNIDIRELTGYGNAWRHGANWPGGPNPIPQSYVTQAATIWRSGEAYVYDPTQQPPACWTVPASNGLQVRKMGSGTAVSTVQAVAGASNTWLVKVTVTPNVGTSAYSLEEVVPKGAIVSSVIGQGVFDPKSSAIRWGPFLDSQARTFTYQVSTRSKGQLAGRVSFDGASAQVSGDRQLGASASSNSRRSGNR